MVGIGGEGVGFLGKKASIGYTNRGLKSNQNPEVVELGVFLDIFPL